MTCNYWNTGNGDIMTHKEWLATLPAQEFYDNFKFVEYTQGVWYTDTRAFMIQWLDKEYDEKFKQEEHNNE